MSKSINLLRNILLLLFANGIFWLIHDPLLRWMTLAPFLLIYPGYLLFEIIAGNRTNTAKTVLFSIGLSIFLLLGTGFALNLILPTLGMHHPLLAIPQWLGINALIIVLSIIHPFRKLGKERTTTKMSLLEWGIILLSSVCPFLSLFGAAYLNNTGSNVLILFMLGCVVVIAALITILNRYVKSEKFHPIVVYMISLSLLLMYSMRSLYVVGWDVQREFKVFRLTQAVQHWSMANYQNAYNATLSVSLLPAILSNILGGNPVYIFKLLDQLIFAIVPVIVYLISRKFSSPLTAFLSSFFFVSQFQFMQQMPALTRQEISIVFFALLVLISLEETFDTKLKYVLFVLSGVAMVVSHYSTTYVALGIFGPSLAIQETYILIRKKISYIGKLELPKIKRYFHFIPISLIFIFTFLWYSQYTGTTNNLGAKLWLSFSNFQSFLSDNNKSEEARAAVSGGSSDATESDLELYTDQIFNQWRKGRNDSYFYDLDSYSQSVLSPQYSQVNPISDFNLYKYMHLWLEIDKKLIKVSLIVGLIFIGFTFLIKHNEYLFGIFSLSSIAMVLLVLLIVLPFASIFYNLDRLYQQSLIVLSLAVVIGLFIVQNKIGSKANKFIGLIVLISYFVLYTGLADQFTGGKASLNLNNFGDDYERYYISQSEILSAQWLQSVRKPNITIYADQYAWLKLISQTDMDPNIIQTVVPETITIRSYLYSTYSNKVLGMTKGPVNGKTVSFKFDKNFFYNKKNIIYSNKDSEIYE